ncbi:LicD family protein [Pelagibacterales bacterium SAG-MED09]|nr:LicD family protein [Pelagibacterales bacterium SAG-MED09]
MTDKTRDRSPEELAARKIEFLKVCDILDSNQIIYYLQTGVLLGAVRNKDFIKWDWDVEVSVFSNDFFPKIDLIVKELESNNFKMINVITKKEDSKIDFFGKYSQDVTKYTIYSWNYSKIKDIYWRRERFVPSKFLNNFSKISLFDRQFNCPKNPEEYLSFAYGNWKIPLRTSDKDLYMSKNFRNAKIVMFDSLKKMIQKNIYAVWKLFK